MTPLKRTPLRRKREMARGTKPLARTTRLKPAGETKRKKDARYRAYLKSPEWRAKRKACLERAGGQCECTWKDSMEIDGERVSFWRRCSERPTSVHHLTYARLFHELPEDLLACCKSHHDELESRLRPWNRNRKWSA